MPDLLGDPLTAFDDDRRIKNGYQASRFKFVVDDDFVDEAQGLKNRFAILLRIDRPAVALESVRRCIGVDADDETIAEISRPLEKIEMALVENVEDAVCEHEFPAGVGGDALYATNVAVGFAMVASMLTNNR